MGKLEECRLRLDPRFLTPAGKKTATERPLYCAATWIRTRLPPGATLFDLKVYKSDQTDGLTSWFGRVRLREDHLAKLLPYRHHSPLSPSPHPLNTPPQPPLATALSPRPPLPLP